MENMSINTKKIKTEMKSQLNIDVVQVSVDGIDEEGAPVSRSESFDGFGFDSTADNGEPTFNPFGGTQNSEKNPFNQSGRIVNTPTTLNIFRQPNLQIKVCFSPKILNNVESTLFLFLGRRGIFSSTLDRASRRTRRQSVLN